MYKIYFFAINIAILTILCLYYLKLQEFGQLKMELNSTKTKTIKMGYSDHANTFVVKFVCLH